MNENRYSMSFTTGGLFRHESVMLAALYLELGDWNAVCENVIGKNLLQTRTLNTSKRIAWEILSRLKTLNTDELELLVKGDHQEQGYLLWLAVCRRYRFIAEFAVEVLRERYISLKMDLTADEFTIFFNGKSEWHPGLDGIRPASRNKLRQVLFRILREADLLNSENRIVGAMFSPRLMDMISHGNQGDIFYFPLVGLEWKKENP